MKKLNSFEWFIYKLLELKTYGTQTRLSQREIYDACVQAGYSVTWDESQNHHNDHCRWLSKAVEHINQSMEVDKLISHHAYRYHLCTYEEALRLLDYYDRKIIAAKTRRKLLHKKMKRHGQGKTTTNAGTTLTDKHEQFHEVFNPVEE